MHNEQERWFGGWDGRRRTGKDEQLGAVVGGREQVQVAREDSAVRIPRARDEQVAVVLDGPADARHVAQRRLQHDLQVGLAALHHSTNFRVDERCTRGTDTGTSH